jgi:heat-inducible transcriptional repressor
MVTDLSEREREILSAVVSLYLTTGKPVPSSAVARRSVPGLSSATIRNVMARLEDRGLLEKPHTSAGRIPSDEGFRLYIAGLLGKAVLSPDDARLLRSLLGSSGTLEELLGRVSRALARVTEEVGVALASAQNRATVQSLHFVPVSPERVLAVVVTQGGHVESRLLNVDSPFTIDELERISSFCTRRFAGLTLAEIRNRVLALMAEERARYDRFLGGVAALGAQLTAGGERGTGELFVDGTERLLDRVGKAQLETVGQLLAAFVDKARLVRLLNTLLTSTGPRALVGSDLFAEGGGLGMIVTSFELSTGEAGLVGVIGLKRMDYPHIIPVVDFIGRYLAEMRG